jgi:diaminopimelate decarboxylase
MGAVSFENSQDRFYLALDGECEVKLQPAQDVTLFGMTCDGMDVIAKSIGVPGDLKVGDWLCLGGMGAYTYGSLQQLQWDEEYRTSHTMEFVGSTTRALNSH